MPGLPPGGAILLFVSHRHPKSLACGLGQKTKELAITLEVITEAFGDGKGPEAVDLKKNAYEVVDILPPDQEERPDETKFLGMYDTKTPEEKVATTPMEKKRGDQKQETKDQRQEKRGDRGKPLERSRDSGPGSLASHAPLEDFYPDFRKGPHTYLNVMRFPDIQYFVRLKRVFKMTFNPVAPLREAYFHNRITQGTIETVLGVSVDGQGQLAEVFVFRGSGIEEFDEEALRTIRASAPFSTPPNKLLDKEGLLRMSWTFTVYL